MSPVCHQLITEINNCKSIWSVIEISNFRLRNLVRLLQILSKKPIYFSFNLTDGRLKLRLDIRLENKN